MTQTTMEEVLPVSTDAGEAKCGICGNKEFRTRTLIIDEQTGERPAAAAGPLVGGILLTLLGLACVVLGVVLVVDPLPSNVDTPPPIYLIAMGLIVLGTLGAPLLRKALGRRKVEVVRPECTVCWAQWEQTGLFHQHRRGRAWSNLCFVGGGLSILFAGPSSESSIVVSLMLLAVGAFLIYGALALRRRSSRALAELLAIVKTDGDYYHCTCGRPKYPYYWAHIALFCTMYGLIALLFPSKKCPKCRTSFAPVAAVE